MTVTRLILALTFAVALLAAALGIAEATASRTDAQRARIERGSYLTTLAGCNDCHTPGFLYGDPDWTRRLSGSELGWTGPWGVSFARNLTPDPETGLGRWSEEQIVTALRTGVRPDGSVLLPPMPWPNFATLSDDDAYAIAAFLKSLPPVVHRVPRVVPPGTAHTGPSMVFPPPPAWDAPRTRSQAAAH